MFFWLDAATTAFVLPPPPAIVVMQQQRQQIQQDQQPNQLLFPTSNSLAALQPDWLGAPAANVNNPGGAGNAEGCAHEKIMVAYHAVV